MMGAMTARGDFMKCMKVCSVRYGPKNRRVPRPGGVSRSLILGDRIAQMRMCRGSTTIGRGSHRVVISLGKTSITSAMLRIDSFAGINQL